MRRVQSHESGFSLLEVLVALALTGTILVSIVQFSTTNARSTQTREAHLKATLVAHSVLAWWERLPDLKKKPLLFQKYQPVFVETGLKDSESYQWRMVSDSDTPALEFIEIKDNNDLTVRIPATWRGTP